jgi:hypothetical protein
MAALLEQESGWRTAMLSSEGRGALAAKDGQATKVTWRGLAHVKCSRTRKMEVATSAVLVRICSLLS